MKRKEVKPDNDIRYDDEDIYDDYSDVEPDNSRWELEANDVLERFEHCLRCETKTTKGDWSRPETARPKMNDDGVSDTIADLRSVMHKGVYLGNTSDNYAVEETKAESRAYMKKLKYNYHKWDVDKSQFKSLVLSYARQIYFALTRSVGDKERIHRNKRMKIQENYKHNEVRPDEIAL